MSLTLFLALMSASQAAVATVVDSLPPTIAGIPKSYHEKPAGHPLVVYRGATATDPLVVVAVGRADGSAEQATRRAIARHQPISLGLRDTLFEGRFAVPAKADAATFFGEYLTDRGLIQVWLIEDRGIRTIVSTTIVRLADRRRMFDAIGRDVLGGAVMIREKPVPIATRRNAPAN